MIIYRDCISQDEMFSDIYSIREVADRLCLEVEGKMVTRTERQITRALIGEGTDPTDINTSDIVMNHHLQATSFTKESYKKYIKDYMKAIKARLEEHKPDRVKPFMARAAEQVKHIIWGLMQGPCLLGLHTAPRSGHHVQPLGREAKGLCVVRAACACSSYWLPFWANGSCGAGAGSGGSARRFPDCPCS
uniref:TCTP domain-containing protein n=1 Tax=Chrysemys picta bellii TaxID=8478 RepID=A0A8C3HR18_CHRPI